MTSLFLLAGRTVHGGVPECPKSCQTPNVELVAEHREWMTFGAGGRKI